MLFLQQPLLWQVHVSVCSGLIMACSIATWSFPAIALPAMSQPHSPIKFTLDQESWFATVQLLMSVPGSFFGGVLCEFMGPRRLLIIVSPLLCASFMLMSMASWEVIVHAGIAEALLMSCRVVQDLSGALMVPVTYTYTYEAAGKDLRGVLTGLLDFHASVGMLLCYGLGCFLSWETIALVVPLLTVFPAFLGVLMSPESPMWLARKGHEEETLSSMSKLRKAAEIPEELEAVKATASKETSFKTSLQEAGKRPNFLSLLAAVFLMLLKEVNGNMVVIIYIVHIFQAAGVGLRPEVSSSVVGAVRVVCNLISVALMHRLSRKPMLSIGTVIASLSMSAIGAFFFFQDENYDVSALGWLPLASLVIFMIGYATLVSPVCWLMSVEVLPGPVRSIGCGTTNTFQTIIAFFVSKTFPSLQAAIGMYGVFWSFSVSSLFCLAVILIWLPETRKLSLQDIEEYWGKMGRKSKEDSLT